MTSGTCFEIGDGENYPHNKDKPSIGLSTGGHNATVLEVNTVLEFSKESESIESIHMIVKMYLLCRWENA